MKKISVFLGALAISTSAAAEVGLTVGVGMESATVAPNYGDCWSECFGDGEPSGFALSLNYAIPGVEGLYFAAEMSDLEDSEDHYDDVEVTVSQERMAYELGYAYGLNDASNLVFAARMADHDWSYEWDDASAGTWTYDATDDGVSFVLGANTQASDKLTLGAEWSFGFETGVAAFAEFALSDGLSVRASLANMSYELGEFAYDQNGGVGTPNDNNGDGDYEFDSQNYRVSLNYAF